MGNIENCCKSDANVDNKNQVETVNPIAGDHKLNLTTQQVLLIVKLQAIIRGVLGRKKCRLMRVQREFVVQGDLGMNMKGTNPTPSYGMIHGEQQVEYENPRVFVSILIKCPSNLTC